MVTVSVYEYAMHKKKQTKKNYEKTKLSNSNLLYWPKLSNKTRQSVYTVYYTINW